MIIFNDEVCILTKKIHAILCGLSHPFKSAVKYLILKQFGIETDFVMHNLGLIGQCDTRNEIKVKLPSRYDALTHAFSFNSLL